ncbi:hypothetical protein DFAR_1860040 [Desulfarculales bacterium]
MQGQARPPSAALGIQLHHGRHWRIPFLAKTRPGGPQLMKPNYRAFFALTRKPFNSALTLKKIMQTAEVLGVAKRFGYAIRLGALALVTGNVWAAGNPPPCVGPPAGCTHPLASDHLDHRLTGLHPGTLQANLRRARSGTPPTSLGPSSPSS